MLAVGATIHEYRQLGQGAFGTVFLVKCGDRSLAHKKIERHSSAARSLAAEIASMEMLTKNRAEHIVKLVASFRTSKISHGK